MKTLVVLSLMCFATLSMAQEDYLQEEEMIYEDEAGHELGQGSTLEREPGGEFSQFGRQEEEAEPELEQESPGLFNSDVPVDEIDYE